MLASSLEPTWGLAFLAGLVSVLSPCVFPLIPAYASYLGGTATATTEGPIVGWRRGKLLLNGGLFVIGFCAVFVMVFYVFAALQVNFFAAHERMVNLVAGIIIIVFALQTLGFIQIKTLLREVRWRSPQNRGPAASFLLGLTFAAGWTPCLGPQLAAIVRVATDLHGFSGLPFMLVYCAGLAIPFLVIALMADHWQGALRRINGNLNLVNTVAGALLLLFGILLALDDLKVLSGLSPSTPFNL